jgi:hypothetical protein
LKVVPELVLLVLAAWAVFLLLDAASFHEKWKRLARRAKLGETHQTFSRALHHEF